MAEPLAVTRQIPELEEEDAGAGKTETEALESTRKFLEERVSLTYRREDEEPAGRNNVSSCWPVIFRPGTGLLTLLGFVSVSPVEPAGGGDRGCGPLMSVRGSLGAGTAGGGGMDEVELLFRLGLGLGGQRVKTGGVGSPEIRFREEA